MGTIKTPAKGIAKDVKGSKAPAAKQVKDLSTLKAAETSGAQESGFKKKRMTPVASIAKP